MLILKDSIMIEKSSEEVFEWFNNFVENYKSWHQKDHVLAKWVKENNFNPDSILYAEEYLGTRLEKLRFKVTRKVPNKLIEYKLLFPESLICTGGGFSFEPREQGCVFTATLSFRFGSILSKLMPSRLYALKKHMKEEGENLKKLLEK
jgi:hypothetical protein